MKEPFKQYEGKVIYSALGNIMTYLAKYHYWKDGYLYFTTIRAGRTKSIDFKTGWAEDDEINPVSMPKPMLDDYRHLIIKAAFIKREE
jgi:hypothetical protein